MNEEKFEELKIIEVTKRELDTFADLRLRYLKERCPDSTMTQAERQERVRLYLDSMIKHIALKSEEPIGYASGWIQETTNPSFFLEDIYVISEYRRRGFGKAITTFQIEDASRRGCLEMLTRIPSNKIVALRMLEGFGFETVWESPNHKQYELRACLD